MPCRLGSDDAKVMSFAVPKQQVSSRLEVGVSNERLEGTVPVSSMSLGLVF